LAGNRTGGCLIYKKTATANIVFDYQQYNYLIKRKAIIFDAHNSKIHMNKADLIDKIAEDTGINKKQASGALESILEGITKALKSGEKVTFVGFGTFSVTRRAARKGRNPATGATIKIKAKKVAKFKSSLELNAKL
jgi:DNA-binding protein HU-beta